MIEITDEEFERMSEDIALGMVSFGVPELFHIFEAIYYGDEEALAYHLKVAGVVHGLWFTGYKLAQAWEYYRHGRSIMPYHTAMSHKGTLMGRALRAISLPVIAVASVYAQAKVWEHIGDPKTGAMHYSRAGTMSGGSMPVLSGSGGHHSTWFDFGDWWESL